MDYSTPGFPALICWSLLKFTSIESVMPSNHLVLCHPLLLPSIFPSIRVFSNELLCIRWPQYWSFSFSVSPFNEYLGLTSFKTEKEMATHSSILAWKIPQTEEPGRLQSMGSQRVGHDWATSLSLSLKIHWISKGSSGSFGDPVGSPCVQATLKSLLQQHNSKASVLQCSTVFTVQLSHPYMTTGKTIALTIHTFVSKVISLLSNMLSMFVIAPVQGASIF